MLAAAALIVSPNVTALHAATIVGAPSQPGTRPEALQQIVGGETEIAAESSSRTESSSSTESTPGVAIETESTDQADPDDGSDDSSPPKEAALDPRDMTSIDIDDLLQVRVTSLAKKEQALGDVPAAVYVIRGDDLRRLGVTTIADALRMVPGLQVARANANTWAISARGFNDTLSNKLLVLIDGRSVYSPLHSGVFWDVQDTLIEDIDRIEVIRGPGGTLWGANAINGVINIVTKSATETRGGLLSGSAGSEDRFLASGRYGFTLGSSAALRVYAKSTDRDDEADGLDPDRRAHDGWTMARVGLRADWTSGDNDRFTISGDYYDGDVEERISAPSLTSPLGFTTLEHTEEVRGGHGLARWEHVFSPSSNFAMQAYFDATYRAEAVFTDTVHTLDLDIQHRFPLGRNDIVWGAGYRVYRSELDGGFGLSVEPTNHRNDVVSAFVQDEITLVPDRLRATIGTKFERNDFSGSELQPSLRLAWMPHDRHMAWVSASRAVRTPSIIDVDGRLDPVVFPGPLPVVVSIFGNEDFRSEVLVAYEAGYRVRPFDPLSLDVSAFYNRYLRLRSGAIGTPFVETAPTPTHVVVPVILMNELKGRTSGVELAANIQASSRWLLQVNYAYLHMSLNEEDVETRNPRHSAWVRSALDLPGRVFVDVMGRYVGSLPTFELDAYIEADARIAWRNPSGRFGMALSGQNLLHRSHPEFDVTAKRSEIQRSARFDLQWSF